MMRNLEQELDEKGREGKKNKWRDINLTYGNCVTPSAAVLGCKMGERESEKMKKKEASRV